MKYVQKWTSSLKFVDILAQCRYTELVQRIFKYSDIQYTNRTLDKIWTVWYIERYSVSTYTETTNFQKQSGFWPTLNNRRANDCNTGLSRSKGIWGSTDLHLLCVVRACVTYVSLYEEVTMVVNLLTVNHKSLLFFWVFPVMQFHTECAVVNARCAVLIK